ncbi:MAG: hypothetical protein ACFCVH_16215 [Alphaproteobacteria bacterium]
MIRRGVAAVAGLGAILALAGPAMADEVWSTNWGTMEYAEDLGPVAVLTYDRGALFIDGLGGNYTNRGYHSGFWMEYYDSGVECDEPAMDDYGNESWSWGYLDVEFIDSGYPARWRAQYTVCDGPVAGTITASPL